MHSPKHPGANFLHGFALAVIALVLLPACSINVKKNEDGEDKKVDIEDNKANNQDASNEKHIEDLLL